MNINPIKPVVPRIVAKTYSETHSRGMIAKGTAKVKEAAPEPNKSHLGQLVDIYV